ncbi:CRISPR-associated endonuclease Cas2 [Actinomyces sp. HMSC065F11]|uniref:CRISPR-associated endonuclease Cas2 n=1 Tax=Actinomyces sp. HMSC065F11 TaxID=1739395 RepID=UPI0008B43F04|nr:CRISPR-associated endonuclease Cas2 [Actinomyces sp. HMSC065F11]OFR33290.1 CRISPR-associated endonuclease Cas2 [Actinomyces sp. HMSC065F11]
MADDPMWLLVMFDLPVKTNEQVRLANRFRTILLDSGFSMVQFSIYARYTPAGGSDTRMLRIIKSNIPYGGKVRILFLTDKQWSGMAKYSNAVEEKPEKAPEQLAFF